VTGAGLPSRVAQVPCSRAGLEGCEMRDNSLKLVLAFTLVYGVVGLVLLMAQPTGGATQAADAEGGLEIAANFGLFKARLATAE
jgi:hypothetical protein